MGPGARRVYDGGFDGFEDPPAAVPEPTEADQRQGALLLAMADELELLSLQFRRAGVDKCGRGCGPRPVALT